MYLEQLNTRLKSKKNIQKLQSAIDTLPMNFQESLEKPENLIEEPV